MKNHISKAFENGDWRSKLSSSKYALGLENNINLAFHLADIDERLKDIEHKINRTERKSITTRKQQIMLLHHLGIFDKLKELKLSNKKLAKLLSILLNASQDNIEGDLSNLYKKDSPLKSADTYMFLKKTFGEVGLKKLAEEADKNLDDIERKK